jgi:RNA polymerase sigma factor (sigma-70 family)
MKLLLGQTFKVQKGNESRCLDPKRVVQARAGDQHAFREIYEVCAPLVHAMLLAHAPTQAVEDLMQDTFSAAWLGLPKLSDESKFQAWVIGIARNISFRFLREQKKAAVVSVDMERLPGVISESATGLQSELLQAIAGFPKRERELLMLRLIEELSATEISTHLDLNPDSTKVQLSRALAKLRQQMKTRNWHG